MITTLIPNPIRHSAIACLLLMAPAIPAANIFVTTTAQKVSSSGGCSLQEAIFSANRHQNTAISGYGQFGPAQVITTQCAAGTPGPNTIFLPAGFFPMSHTVDDADNFTGPTATPIVTSDITIVANGATLQHTGSANFRLFAVGTGGTLTVQNAYIKGFSIKGGDGAAGGGGGLGAGGAIYVFESILYVDSCTFDGNIATGGNGSGLFANAGGGGGGLSGNGSGPISPSHTPGGGGGGGSRGNGGTGSETDPLLGYFLENGGGGGGTVTDALQQTPGFSGGAVGGGTGLCVGSANDGGDGGPGGGGGGGEGPRTAVACFGSGNGGRGGYGGGGGGAAYLDGRGGNGGFGGGGGGGGTESSLTGFGPSGGDAGFGGGGGGSTSGYLTGGPGSGGAYGGNADDPHGGGGGALGGAIFNDSGAVRITNSTFANNVAVRGVGGGGHADNGADAGGAIFSRNGQLIVVNSTISANQGTGSGAGIVVMGDGGTALFTLNDTIIYANGAQACYARGSVSMAGTTNLIDSNGNGGSNFAPCPGAITGADPHLGPLQLNSPGYTPTMAIPSGSPAQNAANSSTSLSVDQRGISRPSNGGYDIGAYEFCIGPVFLPCTLQLVIAQTQTLTLQVSPAGAGTTDPPVGTSTRFLNSVVQIKATAKSGYTFSNWIGNAGNPLSASTSVPMNMDQTVTAVFVAGNTTLGGNILSKSGPANARVWPINVSEAGVVNATGVQITGFTLTQTAGTACTPIVRTPLPVDVPDLTAGGSANVNVIIDFTGCAATARFTASATFSANGGGVTGTMSRTNQFQ